MIVRIDELGAGDLGVLRASAELARAGMNVNCCVRVAAAVSSTLRVNGTPCRICAGAALYRAGADPWIDVVAFCGRENRPDIALGLFHAWVEAKASDGSWWLIDFTPRYWRSASWGEVMPEGMTMRPISWEVVPPDQYVGPLRQLNHRLRHGEHTPPLGKLTLLPCRRTTEVMQARAAALVRDAQRLCVSDGRLVTP